MRIRTIKPEFFLHDGLASLEHETGMPLRIAFAGLWCVADREGRFKWEPRRIGVQVLPYDGLDFSRVLHALTTRDFVQKYEVDGVEYGWIPSFTRHQVINNRERDSELPEPTPDSICDACLTRAPRVPTRDQSCKEEGKGREGKGTGKGTERNIGEEDEVFAKWNSIESLPKIAKISDKRRAAAKCRLKDPYFRENWKMGIETIPDRSFLLGHNDRGWKADIDWFLHPDSLIKIMEGKYSDAKPKPNQQKHSTYQEPELLDQIPIL